MDNDESKARAELDVKSIFSHDRNELPQFIDEWHLAPSIWDTTRRECDKTTDSGNYILTGSTTLSKKIKKEKIKHSGAGRIGIIRMGTMSLYESGDSSGKASIMDMYNGVQKSMPTQEIELKHIANLIVRGGWPRNIGVSEDIIDVLPKGYIDSVLRDEMIDDENKKRDNNKMTMLLRSLARNKSSIVSNSALIKDICEFESDDPLSSKNTIADCLDVLNRLYLLENQNAYSENYRSRKRVGK